MIIKRGMKGSDIIFKHTCRLDLNIFVVFFWGDSVFETLIGSVRNTEALFWVKSQPYCLLASCSAFCQFFFLFYLLSRPHPSRLIPPFLVSALLTSLHFSSSVLRVCGGRGGVKATVYRSVRGDLAKAVAATSRSLRLSTVLSPPQRRPRLSR